MKRLLLVGAVGSAKSAVGLSLSTKTGWPYVDSEALLLRSSGCTAIELLARDGEAGLLAAEANVLTLQLALPGPLVLGIAEDAVRDPATRERLRQAGQVVWLRGSPAVLARRLTGPGQPRGAGQPTGAQRARELDPLFGEVATETVDLDLITAGVAAKTILASLGLDSLGAAPRY